MNPQASASRAAASPRGGRPVLSLRSGGKASTGRGSSGRGAGRSGSAGAVPRRSTGSRSDAGTGGSGRGETPRARGERTRRRVADALVALLEEGDPAPTAKAVAARAGVSVRLVFHHFEDMESLYRSVLALQASEYWDSVNAVPADRSVDDRIDQTVQQRAKLFDAIGAVRRAGVTLAARQPDIAEQLAATDGQLRGWLEETFAPELRSAGRERKELLSALDTSASWEAWDRMRRTEHLSAAASRRVMARTLRSLLS
jgi:TetR/AcrR family transcriptional regulator, regulator of autoinduction and epiphytic fitness